MNAFQNPSALEREFLLVLEMPKFTCFYHFKTLGTWYGLNVIFESWRDDRIHSVLYTGFP